MPYSMLRQLQEVARGSRAELRSFANSAYTARLPPVSSGPGKGVSGLGEVAGPAQVLCSVGVEPCEDVFWDVQDESTGANLGLITLVFQSISRTLHLLPPSCGLAVRLDSSGTWVWRSGGTLRTLTRLAPGRLDRLMARRAQLSGAESRCAQVTIRCLGTVSRAGTELDTGYWWAPILVPNPNDNRR